MIVGIGFFAIGIFIYIKENYNMDIIDEEKTFTRKEINKKDIRYKYKMLICIFSFLLGTFRVLSAIIY